MSDTNQPISNRLLHWSRIQRT